ncbi:MAG: TrkH family potassium uptake protein [Pyramidobacter sp.]|nr:TrkH family potassium uptake protein [Pyramidobacter sp.]
MDFRIVICILSLIGGVVSASMLLPALWAYFDGTPDFPVLALCALFSLGVSGAAFWLSRPRGAIRRGGDFGAREAFAIVSFSWIVASVIGAMPYVLYGSVPTFTDGFFEAMSGFTTTGASILTDIESNPRGILLWRALTHWLGGMGIIVLGLAVMPLLGTGAMELYKAEVPTPIPEKLTPRLHQTAVLLWELYFLLTALETGALMLCGLSFFDSVTHSFATLATGGFSPYNASIAHFASPTVEWVITLFTFLAGVNFTLHYLFLRGEFGAYFKDDEFRFYTWLAAGAAVIMTISALAHAMPGGAAKVFRHAVFQVVTILTTTGFSVTDTEQWPVLCHLTLLLLMFIGGCAGSTGGGIKVLRVLLLARSAGKEMKQTLQPHRVLCVRVNGKPVKNSILTSVTAFFVLYMFIYGALVLFMTALDIDLVSSMSGVLACLSNVGPGLGNYGPVDNYAGVPSVGKWVLSFAMLIGRLELLTVLMLFMPSVWRR